MGSEDVEVATVTSKGQITIPRALREQYEIGEGDLLLAVPTEHGIVLKKIELPSVDEFRRRVEERARDLEVSLEDVEEFVHEARDG